MEDHALAQDRGESLQAPTTNLSSNDPWRDPESPQPPETSRRVLECKKPCGAQGDPGKQGKKDRRGRRGQKPDPATTAATDLSNGPARTRETSAQDLDTQTRQTGRTPTRHSDHARPGSTRACQTGPRTRMGSQVCTTQLWIQTRTLMSRGDRTDMRNHQAHPALCARCRHRQLF